MSPFLGPLERLILVRDGYYDPDPDISRRAAMILALDRGSTPTEVARMARCSRTTVYGWMRRYQEYRDVSALRGAEMREPRGVLLRRARTLNELPPGPGKTRGQLRWRLVEKRTLRMDAKYHADPRLRLRAAILWALNRGVRPTHVAHAAGRSRQTVKDQWQKAIQDDSKRHMPLSPMCPLDYCI